ncbi:MAG: hypothetical protein PHY54_04335 [Methylococcales bacterium]|nr:hypothetical protein [Methylococcales bacterium]
MMLQEIAQYVIGGFIGWSLHGAIGFHIHRRNIRRYLVITISTYLEVIKDNSKILSGYISDNKVNVGFKVSISPHHVADNLEVINSVKNQAIEFLTESEIVKLTRLCFALQDIEAQIEGFCLHIQEHEAGDKVVSKEAHEHLLKHIEKINHLVSQMPTEIKSLQELPQAYDFKIGM